LALFFIAYVLGCGFAQVLAIVPGITVSIWPPGGVFIATLILAPLPSWPWWILVGCLAEMFAQFVWYHSPLAAGLLIYAGNALAAMIGAWLMIRVCGRPVRLETLREVLAFVILCAGVAPLASATVGSAALAWFGVKAQTFTGVWPLFWIGDATGILLVAPLALVVLQNWRSKTRLSPAQWMEAGVLVLIFVGVAALSMSDYYLPFAYIIMPPLLWAAVRFEFKGVAVALSLLALLTMTLTLSGDSQFVGDAETQRERQIMLQLFLAISAFSALIVAAISRQHQQALITLRESERSLRGRERELSQLVDMVPVHIRRLAPDGETVFFNKRLIDFVGMDPAALDRRGKIDLTGTIQTFIHPDDAASLEETIRRSIATGKGYAMKYRLRRADGVYRWMEGRGEPLRDQAGAIVQWYGISIDIDDEMRALQAEDALRHASDKLAQATQAASLAELSASIAHEVNQPLAAIVANSHACQRWLSAEPPNVARAKITAERITRDANSAADVVSRIRALFKQSAEPRNSVALTSVVAEARDLVAEEASRRLIRLDVEVERDLPLVAFDRVQVQQVLVNLIRNGMDAMDAIESDRALGIRVRRAGDVVRTEISDCGRGVDFPDKIFDPFYTTKEHGMGMGLAICRSIVESHRGRLWVERNEPQGAIFIFTLPVVVTADQVDG
jgi:PAS domain S-box-containing protein